MWLVSLALADDSFYPSAAGAPVRYADLLAAGAVTGRTGRLLVRGDPWTVEHNPGVDKVEELPGGLLRVTPRGDDLALARSLHGAPGIRYAVPDVILPLEVRLPDDPLLANQWHLENDGSGGRAEDVDIDAELAWYYATGAGQTIAVIDSGVQLDHPDLSVIGGHDYIDADDDANPGEDSSAPHGTCAAGIAAATGNNGIGVTGVAYDADIYAIRLIGGDTSLEDLYNSFVEAVDAGSTVLSNSWGYGSSCESVPDYDVFDDMFDYAEDVGRGGLGAAVVFAAGNSACDIAGDAMLRRRSLVVVAALESNDSRAWYSSYGDAVDIAAPTSLLTTDMTPGGYGNYGGDDAYADGFGGTSAATPVVSGVFALMFEANPRLTALEARNIVCDTAVRVDFGLADYDSDGRNPYYGCGRIDAGAAVAAVANTAPLAPVPRYVADTAELPRVVLSWIPAEDADGDVMFHRVRWSLGGEEVTAEVDGDHLDLSADVVEGDVVTWTVAAVDPWGEGPESEPLSLTIVALEQPVAPVVTEEEPTTCGGGSPWVLGAGLALLGVARRRAPRSL